MWKWQKSVLSHMKDLFDKSSSKALETSAICQELLMWSFTKKLINASGFGIGHETCSPKRNLSKGSRVYYLVNNLDSLNKGTFYLKLMNLTEFLGGMTYSSSLQSYFSVTSILVKLFLFSSTSHRAGWIIIKPVWGKLSRKFSIQ